MGLMRQLGIDEERLKLEWISAAEGAKFADTVREYTEQIRALGPLHSVSLAVAAR
jgi:F420-non-reducing hydrogenase iron-sulfur subunit